MADVTTQENAGRKPIRLDMTPMVDLAFLLVTFFMLTTTFSKPRILELAMPDHNPGKPAPVSQALTTTLVLDKDNRIYYYRGLEDPKLVPTSYAPDGLRKIAMEMVKKGEGQKKDAVFIIKPTDGASYQNVVDVLDEMKITNAQVYAIQKIYPQELAMIKKYKLEHSIP